MAVPRKAERARLARAGEAQGRPAKGAPVGSYPTDSKGRAVAAKARATDAVRAGRMSKATERGIDARADRKLGRKAGTKKRA